MLENKADASLKQFSCPWSAFVYADNGTATVEVQLNGNMEKLTRVVAGWWCKGAEVWGADGRVLLVQRHPNKVAEWSETWALPGGKIEEGETPEEALRREWKEELSADAVVGMHLCTYIYRTEGYPHPVQISVYLIESSTEPTLTHAGGQAIEWIGFNLLNTRDCLDSTFEARASYYALQGI